MTKETIEEVLKIINETLDDYLKPLEEQKRITIQNAYQSPTAEGCGTCMGRLVEIATKMFVVEDVKKELNRALKKEV